MLQTPGRKLLREYRSSAHWLHIILDLVLVCGLLYVHTLLRGAPFESEYQILAILTILLMATVYHLSGVYQPDSSVYRKFILLGQSWLAVVALLIIFAFITKTSTQFSREVILSWMLTGFITQLISLFAVRYLQKQYGSQQIRSIIIGNGTLAQHLAEQINTSLWVPDKIIGQVSPEADNPLSVNTLGDVADIEKIVSDNRIQRVYLALSMEQAEWVQPLYTRLAQQQVDIIWAPDIFNVELLHHSLREIGGVPLIVLSETPQIGNNAFLKSLLDYSVASIALVALTPVLLATAVCVKLTSPGPVFFRQERHGWNGEKFTIYKFRSMAIHQETEGKLTQATRDDSRVTAVGRFIRRTSIDELPQLINVLNGSMSIVGPRPHAIAHNMLYGEKIKSYMRRHRVKPGLTGLAQVNGYRGETRNLEDMQGRIQYDLAYINNWSLWLDIKIILKTVFVLFDKKAY